VSRSRRTHKDRNGPYCSRFPTVLLCIFLFVGTSCGFTVYSYDSDPHSELSENEGCPETDDEVLSTDLALPGRKLNGQFVARGTRDLGTRQTKREQSSTKQSSFAPNWLSVSMGAGLPLRS